MCNDNIKRVYKGDNNFLISLVNYNAKDLTFRDKTLGSFLRTYHRFILATAGTSIRSYSH